MSSNKLHLRITRIITLGAIVFTMVASSISYFYARSVEQRLSEKALNQLFSTVENSAEIAAYLDNEALALEVVKSLTKNDKIAGSTILSLTGMNITSDIALNSAKSLNFPLYDPFTPSERIGEMRLYPNLVMMNARVQNTTLEHVLILAIQTLVIAILGLILMRRILTQPIQLIAAGLHRIIPGDDRCLVCPSGHEKDEIGNLVVDINKLLESTRATIKQERLLRSQVENLEKHFRLIFERASAGIFLLDSHLRLASVNQAFKNIIGIAMEERRTDKLSPYLPVLFFEPEVVRNLLQDVLRSGQKIARDLRLNTPDNSEERWLHCLFSTVKNDTGEILIEGLVVDVTERTFQMERILFESEHDPLTKLFNRRAGEQLLNILLGDAKNNNRRLALLLIDLDGFKQINDNFGHESGDKVLVEVASRMQATMRKEDILIRLGGDEFVIAFLPKNENTDEINRVVNKLLKQFNTDVILHNNSTITVGGSIGIAIFPEDGENIETLIASADLAMYQSKRKGRNCATYLKSAS